LEVIFPLSGNPLFNHLLDARVEAVWGQRKMKMMAVDKRHFWKTPSATA